MRTIMNFLIIAFGILFIFPFHGKSQNLPEVIALREVELHDQTNELIFLNYYNKWCDQVKEHSKGACGWVMKGDRGERQGEYIFAWAFNFVGTRDYYFPGSEMSNYPQWNAVLNRFDFHAPEQQLVDSIYAYTDFVVLGYSGMIAPQLGELIAVRYFDIPEKQQAKFERFVTNEYHIAYQRHIEGYFNYVLKADRGAREGSYLLLTVFDSADRRNAYYPVPGEPASESFMEQWEYVSEVEDEFRTYLPESLDSEYTDYIVVYK